MDLSQLRDGRVARSVAARIAAEVEPGRRYTFMEFCGGHTYAIFRHDLDALLPAAIRLVHGPGCPVCVLPRQRLAQALVAECFEPRPRFEWRGLGVIPYSALTLRERFAAVDAERVFDLATDTEPDHPACRCGAVLRGVAEPSDCRLFATACTPDTPIGSCMVSHEGTCAAYFAYRRSR